MALRRPVSMDETEEVEPPSMSEAKGESVYEAKLARVRAQAWRDIQELSLEEDDDDTQYPKDIRSLYAQLRSVLNRIEENKDQVNAFLFAAWVQRIIEYRLVPRDEAEIYGWMVRPKDKEELKQMERNTVLTTSYLIAAFARCGLLVNQPPIDSLQGLYFDGNSCTFQRDLQQTLSAPADGHRLFLTWAQNQFDQGNLSNVPSHLRVNPAHVVDSYHAPLQQRFEMAIAYRGIVPEDMLAPTAHSAFDFAQTLVPLTHLQSWATRLAFGDPRALRDLRRRYRMNKGNRSVFWVILQVVLCIAPCPAPDKQMAFFRLLQTLVSSENLGELTDSQMYLHSLWNVDTYETICRGDYTVHIPKDGKEEKTPTPYNTNSDWHFQLVLERALNYLVHSWTMKPANPAPAYYRTYVIRSQPSNNDNLPIIKNGRALLFSQDRIRPVALENARIAWPEGAWFIVVSAAVYDESDALYGVPEENNVSSAFMPPDRTKIRVSDCWFFRAYVPADIERKERFLGRYAPFTRVICAPLL